MIGLTLFWFVGIRLKLFSGHGQVVSHSTSPEWKEGFTWAFDVPPKGQKLHIICKSKSTFGKVTIPAIVVLDQNYFIKMFFQTDTASRVRL